MEATALKEVVADLLLENRLLKKVERGWGGRGMRYPGSERLREIPIQLVEQSIAGPRHWTNGVATFSVVCDL